MISGSVPEWMESFPPESMTSLQNSMVGWYEWSVGVVACSHTRFVNRWTSDSVSVGVIRSLRHGHGALVMGHRSRWFCWGGDATQPEDEIPGVPRGGLTIVLVHSR